MARIVGCGEAMLELSRLRGAGGETAGGPLGDGAYALGYGGDTLNTAIHLARAGHEVAYLTALGSDAFSQRLTRAWAAEGLDTALVLAHPRRQPGLYAIV